MSNSKFSSFREIRDILTPLNKEQGGGAVLYVDSETAQVYVLNSEGHLILLGQSGTGKTRRGVVSMILSWILSKESFTVVDPKGDLRDITWCFAKDAGYETITINFRELKKSTSFNPLWYPYLLYKAGKIDKASDLIRAFVISILKYNKNADPFWIDSARSLIEACIYLLFEYGNPEEINILSVIKMIAAGVERFGPKKVFDIICEDCPDSIADFLLKNVRTAPSDTLNSILSSAFQPLNIFVESPSLIEILTNNEFKIEELDVEKPFACYIVTPDENTNYSSITATIVTQITEHLIQLAHDKYSGKLPRRVNICIEECGNLGELPNLGHLMSAGRSRNLRMAIVLQSLTQLDEIYGKSAAETIVTNADTIIAFRTNRWETLEELSRKMGNRQIDYGHRVSEERLIKPEEIGAMETGRALIMISGRIKYSTVLPDFTEIFPMDKWYPPQDAKHKRTKAKIFDLKKEAMNLVKTPETESPFSLFAAQSHDRVENLREEAAFRIKNQIKKDDLYYRVEVKMRLLSKTYVKKYEEIVSLINKHRINKAHANGTGEFWVFFTGEKNALAFTKELKTKAIDVTCSICISDNDYDEDDTVF